MGTAAEEKKKAIDALMRRRGAIHGRGGGPPQPIPDIPDRDKPLATTKNKKKKRSFWHMISGGGKDD